MKQPDSYQYPKIIGSIATIVKTAANEVATVSCTRGDILLNMLETIRPTIKPPQ